jgi:hypothetical protein
VAFISFASKLFVSHHEMPGKALNIEEDPNAPATVLLPAEVR